MYLKKLYKFSRQEYIKKNYSLDNIRKVLLQLGNPQDHLNNIIHITGTNGKGSVALYTAKILYGYGFKVGCFTSPHILKINERIKINFKSISDYELEKYLSYIFPIMKNLQIPLTFFEIITCVMFKYFHDKKTEFNIIEVGLGGKLDATNVINKSLISIITNVSLDHTEILGKTKYQIVADKSGIIKKNSICITSESDSRIAKKIEILSKRKKTKFYKVKLIDKNAIMLDYKRWKCYFNDESELKLGKLSLPLCSYVQPSNVNIVLKIIYLLFRHRYIRNIDATIIKKSFNIKIPYRMEKVNKNIFFDGAHNPKSLENFVKTIQLSPFDKITICFTMMKEKDYKRSIKILSKLKNKVQKFLVYRINMHRSQSIDLLYSEALKYFKEKVKKISGEKNLISYLKDRRNIFFVGTFYNGRIYEKLRYNNFR